MASLHKQDSQAPSAQHSNNAASPASPSPRRGTVQSPGNPSRATQAEKMTGPSYARPTISFQAKSHRLCTTSNHIGAHESSSPCKGNSLAESEKQKHKQRHFKTARQSTISSRRKALWPAPFRFFGLPADIRNIIYGYMELEEGLNEIKMISDPGLRPWNSPGPVLVINLDVRNWQYRMPAMLRVENARLRSEFASFYFTKRLIRIWVGIRREPQQMRKFLNFIGAANRRLLDENKDYVHVAFQRAFDLVQRRDWGLKERREPAVWTARDRLAAIGYDWSESSGYVFDSPSRWSLDS
ncbi:hypothetical protein AC579_5641 [Pseudocercospora musae]|uniref:Uncharacterized protein n=1 Tax=Pseudocercospora musae TaxID=113226 RepID=A0A139IEJ9_9PEZI|nr:hypothetical protein AC579_5641 [Pseudocercospora musae]